MQTYLAFLRGINVGGNGLIKMVDLKECLASSGLQNVRTYIQSGNVLFESSLSNKTKLVTQISCAIEESFNLQVAVVVFTDKEWHKIVQSAPDWWGKDPSWKHNILILTEQYDMPAVIEAIGKLKPDIETMQAGDGVIYQSLSFDTFGRTTSGKLVSNPIYKKMTIRNYNTAVKLASMLV